LEARKDQLNRMVKDSDGNDFKSGLSVGMSIAAAF